MVNMFLNSECSEECALVSDYNVFFFFFTNNVSDKFLGEECFLWHGL